MRVHEFLWKSPSLLEHVDTQNEIQPRRAWDSIDCVLAMRRSDRLNLLNSSWLKSVKRMRHGFFQKATLSTSFKSIVLNAAMWGDYRVGLYSWNFLDPTVRFFLLLR